MERRFADVIIAVEALQEEVRKSERDRKESDKVRDEQHKELVRMIQTLQGTSTQMHTDDPFHYEAPGVIPQQGLGSQRDSVETFHEDTAALPRRDSVPPPQQDSDVVHDTEAFDQGTTSLPHKDAVLPP